MEQAILNLQHLTKSFDGKKILDDLSIDIGRNEFVTLLRSFRLWQDYHIAYHWWFCDTG